MTGADPAAAFRAAGAAARAGDIARAAALVAPVAGDLPVPQRAEAHGLIGAAAFARGDFVGAAEAFAARAALDPRPEAAFDHARAVQAGGDEAGALALMLPLLRRERPNARWFLFAGLALRRLGREADALAVWSLGDRLDPALRAAWSMRGVAGDVARASREADAALRGALSDLHREAARGVPRIEAAVWRQTHDGPLPPVGAARPHLFHVPGLPDRAWFDALDWAPALEAKAGAIRAEVAAARGRAAHRPYVHGGARGPSWAALRGTDAWSSVHLYQDGAAREAERFPVTVAALADLPVVRLGGVPIEVFLSVLAPGTRIPPHHGVSNARLTVHLPLVVPDGEAGIRVGEGTRRWREGYVLAFDDSVEHEAWNETNAERVVLIFEAWRPELSRAERDAVTRSYAARTAWLEEARLPQA